MKYVKSWKSRESEISHVIALRVKAEGTDIDYILGGKSQISEIVKISMGRVRPHEIVLVAKI